MNEVHFSPVFDRIQAPVQIEKRERHALIRRRHTRHTRHTRPGGGCGVFVAFLALICTRIGRHRKKKSSR